MREASKERVLADADRIVRCSTGMFSELTKQLMEVEASRDLSQTIVHVDVDAFYAAVECQRDPSLMGKAFGVGQGVLTTASVSFYACFKADDSTRRGNSGVARVWPDSSRRSFARISFCELLQSCETYAQDGASLQSLH